MKVIIGLAVVAVLAALGTNWLRHKGEDLLHSSFDSALPSKVEAHPWTPVEHGRPQRADRVSFAGGSVTSVRCSATLGGYSVHVDHAFSFTKAPGPLRPGCPGRKLQARLAKATRVDVEDHGKSQRLVFTEDDHTVARLQGRG